MVGAATALTGGHRIRLDILDDNGQVVTRGDNLPAVTVDGTQADTDVLNLSVGDQIDFQALIRRDVGEVLDALGTTPQEIDLPVEFVLLDVQSEPCQARSGVVPDGTMPHGECVPLQGQNPKDELELENTRSTPSRHGPIAPGLWRGSEVSLGPIYSYGLVSQAETIELLREYSEALRRWFDGLFEEDEEDILRSFINRSTPAVREALMAAGEFRRVTFAPPPALGGVVHSGADPLDHVLESPHGASPIPMIRDMLDRAVGVYENEESLSSRQSSEEAPMPTAQSDQEESKVSRKVFVVHGRDRAVRDAMFQFLRAIGLEPIEWSQAVSLTGSGTPMISDILERAFAEANAVVVLMTGDDEARLAQRLVHHSDPAYESQLTPQARSNVLFEAGMAFGTHPKQTVLVEIGRLRPFSDVAGRHVIRLNNTSAMRQQLAQRLQDAGCQVDLSGTDWHTVGDLEVAHAAAPSAPIGTEHASEGTSEDSLHAALDLVLREFDALKRAYEDDSAVAPPNEKDMSKIQNARKGLERAVDLYSGLVPRILDSEERQYHLRLLKDLEESTRLERDSYPMGLVAFATPGNHGLGDPLSMIQNWLRTAELNRARRKPEDS